MADVLWEPTAATSRDANITHYLEWLRSERGLSFGDYDTLWRWSVERLEDFWASIWDYYGVGAASGYGTVLADRAMPGARWFTGARLNYAEQVLARATGERPALIARGESTALHEVSWETLRGQVGALAEALRERGVSKSDRVAAYVSNLPEAVVAMLAVTSIGAV